MKKREEKCKNREHGTAAESGIEICVYVIEGRELLLLEARVASYRCDTRHGSRREK